MFHYDFWVILLSLLARISRAQGIRVLRIWALRIVVHPQGCAGIVYSDFIEKLKKSCVAGVVRTKLLFVRNRGTPTVNLFLKLREKEELELRLVLHTYALGVLGEERNPQNAKGLL
jgi:hypothetical protein